MNIKGEREEKNSRVKCGCSSAGRLEKRVKHISHRLSREWAECRLELNDGQWHKREVVSMISQYSRARTWDIRDRLADLYFSCEHKQRLSTTICMANWSIASWWASHKQGVVCLLSKCSHCVSSACAVSTNSLNVSITWVLSLVSEKCAIAKRQEIAVGFFLYYQVVSSFWIYFVL